MLVAYSNSANYVATTAEYLAAFGRHSSWDVRYLHVTHHAEPVVDLRDYDAVLQSYCARLPMAGHVSPAWIEALTAFQGVKVLAVQDEYDFTNRLHAAINDVGFDVVLTCVPRATVERVYPAAKFPRTAFVQVLTGYVPETLPKRAGGVPLSARPVTIGYRGRDISPRYGRLGFDKLDIGIRMKVACLAGGVSHDIAWGEADRLYGAAWYDWIGACRVNLATESGSNAFDWDGAIVEECARRTAAGTLGWTEFLDWVAPFEAGYDMGQISPRIFEAAAMRTALVCYPGAYSGILQPGEHYIPLERDFANIDDVLRRIDDVDALNDMVTRAWYELIGSGRYGYDRLAAKVDSALAAAALRKGVPRRGPLTGRDHETPMVDCPALRSMAEYPTRAPQSPLVFAFKQIAWLQDRLAPALARQTTLTAALAQRLREETADHTQAISDARVAALVAQQAQANGATG